MLNLYYNKTIDDEMKGDTTMRGLAVLMAVGLIITAGYFSTVYAGTYQSCTPCHNGRTAPDLRGRFSSADELIRAAKRAKSPMMANIQVNEPLLRAAAKDLGLE
jgi:hypothetical protein